MSEWRSWCWGGYLPQTCLNGKKGGGRRKMAPIFLTSPAPLFFQLSSTFTLSMCASGPQISVKFRPFYLQLNIGIKYRVMVAVQVHRWASILNRILISLSPLQTQRKNIEISPLPPFYPISAGIIQYSFPSSFWYRTITFPSIINKMPIYSGLFFIKGKVWIYWGKL